MRMIIFNDKERLEMIQCVARARYIATGDEWWKKLALTVGKKLEDRRGEYSRPNNSRNWKKDKWWIKQRR